MEQQTPIRIFSFDAETNGLWGTPFAIAAVVYENGKEVSSFAARCSIADPINDWVIDNVLPNITDMPIDCDNYQHLLEHFSRYYMSVKTSGPVYHIGHIVVPVESSLIKDMNYHGFIGDWDAPYPLIDVSAMLLMAGEDPTSVDAYIKKYGITIPFTGSTHHPLYDSIACAEVYHHLLSHKK